MDAVSDSVALAELGLNAVDLFHKVEKVLKEHADDAWLEDAFAAESERFELWAANMGLFVAGHGSLDYRVREAERLAQTLRRFIQDLINTLEDVFQMCSNSSQEDASGMGGSSGDWSITEAPADKDGDEEELDMKILVDSIRDPINRIFKISTKIRNPSTRLGSSRAANCRQVDEETGVDFLQAIKEADLDYVKSVFLEYRKARARRESRPVEAPRGSSGDEKDDGIWEPITTVLTQEKERERTGTNSYLIERIAQANVRRRQQFAYWAKHRDKLDKHTKAFQAQKTRPPTAQQPSESLLQFTPGPVPSVTTATMLDIEALEISDKRSDWTVSEYAPSTRQAADAPVDFPPAPKIQRKTRPGKFFECPYCFFLCPKEILAKKAWEAHLIHDLRPYICTYEYCRSPGQLYDSRKDWAQHENSEHRRIWRCPEHSNQDFTKLETYKRHLREQHAEPISGEASLARIIQASEFVSDTTDRACPVCMVELDTNRAMEGHIALHLERFARFSLPRSVGNDDDGSNADSGKANRVDEEGSRDDDFEGDFELHSDMSASDTQVTGRLPEVGSSGSSHGLGSTGGILQAFQAFDGDDGESGQAHHDTRQSTDSKASFDDFKDSDERAHPQKYEEVEQRYRDALEQTKKALGSEHLDTLAAMNELCQVLYKQGKYVESEQIDREVLELRKNVLGSKDPETLRSMSNLAITLLNLGRLDESEKLGAEAMETREQVLGPTHADTLMSMANLAITLYSLGRLEESEKMGAEAMEMRKLVLGPAHADTLMSMANLVTIYYRLGRFEEAEQLGVEVMETRKQILGPDHPSTLRSMAKVADILRVQVKLEEAEKLEKEVMVSRKQRLGSAHPDTIRSMGNLALTWHSQGRSAEAIALMDSCVQLCGEVLGPEHSDTASAIKRLDDWRAERDPNSFEELDKLII